MRKYRKELAVILAVLLVLCVTGKGINVLLHKKYADAFQEAGTGREPGTSEARETKDEYFTYCIIEKSDTVMMVTYQGDYLEDKKIREVAVPEEIEGRRVTCIDDCLFSWVEKLETVTLPNNLEEIRKEIVFKSPKLKKVICAGDNLKEIDEYAFVGFSGTIITKENSLLWKHAKEHNLKVERMEEAQGDS